MDLPLWQPVQGHVMLNERDYHVEHSWFGHYSGYGSDNNQSSYCIGDNSLFDIYFGYGQDVIEEDVLNEKSCVQVLRIMMDKADEEIVKLEEDIVMIQCQLAWDDEDWSKACSAALRENIDNLDNLIWSLTLDNTKDGHCFSVQLDQPQKSPQRLHDLVKPLLENYLSAKTKQAKGSIAEMSVPSGVTLGAKDPVASTSKHVKKLEKKECFKMQEHNDGRSPSMEPQDRKTKNLQQRKDADITKCISDVHRCANYMLSNDINKFNRLHRKRTTNFAPGQSGKKSFNKSELSSPTLKDSRTSNSTGRGGSRERNKSKSTNKEAIPMEKTTEHMPQLESTVMNKHQKSQETERKIAETVKTAGVQQDSEFSYVKQMTEASWEMQKARMPRHVIKQNMLFTKPLTKIKRSRKVLEAKTTEMKDNNADSLIRLFNDGTKHEVKPKVKSNSITQLQQAHASQENSVSSLMREDQGPEKICKADPEIVEQICKGQQEIGGMKKLREDWKKETQQESSGVEIDGASDGSIASSSKKKRKLSFDSQNIRARGLRNFLMELKKLDFDNPNTTDQEAIDNCSMEDLPQNSLLSIKDVDRLSLKDLKTIARSQKLPGYYKLRKAELQKRLGLQPQKANEKKGTFPANRK